MVKALQFFIRYVLFWLFYFAFFRSVFYVLDYSSEHVSNKLIQYPLVLFHSVRLDFSTIGYVSVIPLILFFLNGFVYHKVWKKIVGVLTVILLGLFSVILISNIFLYQSWGTLLNSRALGFISDPAEIIASLTTIELVASLFSIVALVIVFKKIFNKMVQPYFINPASSILTKIATDILFVFFTALMMRGGWQQIPINESAAYFSNDVRLNHIATNPVWFLGHNIKQAQDTDENTYKFFSDKEATALVEKLFHKNNLKDTINILKVTRPNVVFIIVESYTADLIRSLGGDQTTAPNFEKLFRDGLLFTNIYSSGFRTDQAFVSVLSGFPAQPDKSIIRYPEKTRFLPSLPAVMEKQGYTTSFYYGGELGFSNLYSYLVNCGFDKIIGKNDFQSSQFNSKWGAHDEYVLNRQLNDLSTMKQPFFSVLMTLTSHEPYESPIATPFTGSDPPSKFRSVAWYTDKCLGEYFDEAKQQSWYANTLYIIVADHGHLLPKERTFTDPAVRHIPLLITGGALKDEYRNKKVSVTGNQNDIASTFLNQMELPDSTFVWSNDLLNSQRKNFAYLCMDDYIGWVTDKGPVLYNVRENKVSLQKRCECPFDVNTTKAYLQKLYRDFLRN